MPSDLLLSSILLAVLVFCALMAYVYKIWAKDAKQIEAQRMALEDVRDDLTRTRRGLENEKNERVQVEQQIIDLKQKLESIIIERQSDRTAYQSLFDKLEAQMSQKMAELNEKEKAIRDLRRTPPPSPPESFIDPSAEHPG